jgi:hypothetical protein
MNHIALLHQQFLGLRAYGLNHGICEKLFTVEPGDAFIEVDVGCERQGQRSPRRSIFDDAAAVHVLGRPGIVAFECSNIQRFERTGSNAGVEVGAIRKICRSETRRGSVRQMHRAQIWMV